MNEKQTILIVDDSMLNRALLADMIGDAYRIVEAEDGKQAVAALQKEGTGISLVLLDYVMPQMNGFDVLEVMNRNGWIKDIPVIMVSAESDAAYIERAYELGVTDFINRPYDVNIVRRRVMNTLMLYQKQRTLMGMVADQVYEREKSNNLMVYILSHIVEFRNGESGMHVLNVQAMTEMILTQLTRLTDQYPLTTEDISLITMASSLHDIGKIAIPEEILNKPGRFTDEEFAIMKTHSAVGSDMLDDLELYKDEKLVKVMQMRASEIGAASPICVSVHANLTDVCRVLAENHLKKVPVLEEGHIVGIINRSDITQYSMAAYLAGNPDRAVYCGDGPSGQHECVEEKQCDCGCEEGK